MEKKTSIVVAVMIVALLLIVACSSSDEQDRIFGDAHERIAEEGTDSQETPQVVDNDSGGVLTILVSDYYLEDVKQMFTNHFQRERPEIELVIETFSVRDPFAYDITEQTALVTRLMADPPDVFIRPHFVSYEKLAVDSLFLDLNKFIDGVNGINRDDYFDNVLRASQTGDALYHVPLMVKTNSVMLGREHFESIGADISNMHAISMRESLDYFHMASDVYSGTLLLELSFNLTEVFLLENVYYIETGEVFVNTPEMRELLLEVAAIPIREGIQFLPDEVNTRRTYMFPAVDEMYGYTNYMQMSFESLSGAPFITFLADFHPAMQFSRPIHRITENGDISFINNIGASIMQSSPNSELAWEFIRFCMEITDSMIVDYVWLGNNPINRERFDSWAHDLMVIVGYEMVRPRRGWFWAIELVNPEEIADAVSDGVSHFRGMMEDLNAEDRRNIAVFSSMIYPDLYLFATGMQDVDLTLANIQNRLELYINE